MTDIILNDALFYKKVIAFPGPQDYISNTVLTNRLQYQYPRVIHSFFIPSILFPVFPSIFPSRNRLTSDWYCWFSQLSIQISSLPLFSPVLSAFTTGLLAQTFLTPGLSNRNSLQTLLLEPHSHHCAR